MSSVERVLMGPGPSNVPARVLEALSRPTIGHLDPVFLELLDETQGMLRQVFGTENALTLPMSATGSAGMETCFVNLLEPGDHALICRHGVFGGRMAVYSGTQKCLSCPPGLSPVSFSERAREVLSTRKTPVQSWYFDLNLIGRYFGGERVYHHTAPVNMIFALHEALRLVLEEGLAARYARHREQANALRQGLEALGLELLVSESVRLPPLTLIRIPDGIDDCTVRAKLLTDHSLEIGGGLGDFKGKAWRIGLMGASATPRHVELCLEALQTVVP
jgi:aspartate aminotransferase-like enzyme